MSIISFAMIAELNELLKSEQVMLTLKDMCGSQIVSIKTLSGEKPSEIPMTVYEKIEQYLSMKFMKPSYNEEKTSFSV